MSLHLPVRQRLITATRSTPNEPSHSDGQANPTKCYQKADVWYLGNLILMYTV